MRPHVQAAVGFAHQQPLTHILDAQAEGMCRSGSEWMPTQRTSQPGIRPFCTSTPLLHTGHALLQ